MEIVPDDAIPAGDTSRQFIVSSDETTSSRPITASGAMEGGFVHSTRKLPATDFSWLRRGSTTVAAMKPDGGGGDVGSNCSLYATAHRLSSARGSVSFSGRSPVGQECVGFLGLSPTEEWERFAVALDRMGGAIVEVRDAFERWVMPVIVETNTDVKSAGKMETAVTSAMTELRLPMKVAAEFSKGAGAKNLGSITFSEFVGRYAEAAGLQREISHPRGTQVWAEGPEGMWIALSPERLAGARAVFYGATEEFKETSSYSGGACSCPGYRRLCSLCKIGIA